MGLNGNLKYVFLHAIDPDKLYINNGQPTLICEKPRHKLEKTQMVKTRNKLLRRKLFYCQMRL
jgi:hypothetical protein